MDRGSVPAIRKGGNQLTKGRYTVEKFNEIKTKMNEGVKTKYEKREQFSRQKVKSENNNLVSI